MGDDNSILAPSPDSIKATIANQVKNYTTQAGDTLQSIAAANGVSVNTIKWSNPALTHQYIEPGWNLVIPPVDGVVVTADSNTTLPDLAEEYNPERYNTDATVRANSAALALGHHNFLQRPGQRRRRGRGPDYYNSGGSCCRTAGAKSRP